MIGGLLDLVDELLGMVGSGAAALTYVSLKRVLLAWLEAC